MGEAGEGRRAGSPPSRAEGAHTGQEYREGDEQTQREKRSFFLGGEALTLVKASASPPSGGNKPYCTFKNKTRTVPKPCFLCPASEWVFSNMTHTRVCFLAGTGAVEVWRGCSGSGASSRHPSPALQHFLLISCFPGPAVLPSSWVCPKATRLRVLNGRALARDSSVWLLHVTLAQGSCSVVR